MIMTAILLNLKENERTNTNKDLPLYTDSIIIGQYDNNELTKIFVT